MSGVYIHIPFCKQKCSYCDFHFSTNFQGYRGRIIKTIIEELIMRNDDLENASVSSVYFGGGTPSLLTYDELTTILNVVYDNYQITNDVEITLEANPDDVTPNRVSEWKAAGITRFSLGVQSFRNKDLEWMNRAHNANEAVHSIELIKNGGFDNFSVDLIYGSPDLSDEDWQFQLEKLISLGVPHISAYCLTIEDHTVLSHKTKRGDFHPATDDEQAKQFLRLMEITSGAGFEHYEISNFARPGFRSKHNSSYWQSKPYIGIGPSAHSFDGNRRSWNISNNMLYMKGIEEGKRNFEVEELTGKDRFNELLLTGLRTVEGVSIRQLNEITGIPESFWMELEKFSDTNWIETSEERLILTKEGRLRADHIAASLFL